MTKPPEAKRRALGKGLTALLPTRPLTAVTVPQEPAAPSDGVARLAVDLIDPNPHQPRHVFDGNRLEELAQSIRTNGVIQPVVVRPAGNRYQLVAGERRWRAARIAGLATIPAVIQEIPDDRLLELTLVENIQREDLNPIELANAFVSLAAELHLTHEQIAERTGKDRTTITNVVRLLQLPEDLQQMVADRRLSQGHARAVLSLPTVDLQRRLAQQIVDSGLSVRQAEQLSRIASQPRQPKPAAAPPAPQDPNVKAAVDELERVLGTRVRLVEMSGNRGKIEIEYYSAEDLDRIYGLIVATDREP
ncbi:MAG: ParB/RepB/Spo0J family partition protein [Bryobacterales bacterium]|nr:ParB/RepB/Spo0J family partition protein [Bryobacterales bacterium]